MAISDKDGILVSANKAYLNLYGYTKDEIIGHNFSIIFAPDVIILDLLLSGKDGRHICLELKNVPLLKSIPVIMMSAHPGANISAKKAGANDFIAKPFEIDNLLETIKNFTK